MNKFPLAPEEKGALWAQSGILQFSITPRAHTFFVSQIFVLDSPIQRLTCVKTIRFRLEASRPLRRRGPRQMELESVLKICPALHL